MLKSAKGEVSAGLIVGIGLLIVIIGLVMWFKNKKPASIAPDEPANVPVMNTPTMTTGSPAPKSYTIPVAPTPAPTPTTNTQPVTPSFPQTGFGPDEPAK